MVAVHVGQDRAVVARKRYERGESLSLGFDRMVQGFRRNAEPLCRFLQSARVFKVRRNAEQAIDLGFVVPGRGRRQGVFRLAMSD
jgi:hypothetical protein